MLLEAHCTRNCFSQQQEIQRDPLRMNMAPALLAILNTRLYEEFGSGIARDATRALLETSHFLAMA